mmetsp:Transcript_19822/g.34029  ORF Transcript_19822/g.34029 Transcript_19822/m.34029 type:complete len:327 (-) Transcript_19822:489-1469(-)
MRMHTKEEPYACTFPGCGKQYKWRSCLTSHLQTHEKYAKAEVVAPQISATPMAHAVVAPIKPEDVNKIKKASQRAAEAGSSKSMVPTVSDSSNSHDPIPNAVAGLHSLSQIAPMILGLKAENPSTHTVSPILQGGVGPSDAHDFKPLSAISEATVTAVDPSLSGPAAAALSSSVQAVDSKTIHKSKQGSPTNSRKENATGVDIVTTPRRSNDMNDKRLQADESAKTPETIRTNWGDLANAKAKLDYGMEANAIHVKKSKHLVPPQAPPSLASAPIYQTVVAVSNEAPKGIQYNPVAHSNAPHTSDATHSSNLKRKKETSDPDSCSS